MRMVSMILEVDWKFPWSWHEDSNRMIEDNTWMCMLPFFSPLCVAVQLDRWQQHAVLDCS